MCNVLMCNKARESFTLPLNLIQVSRLHLQELVDGDAGAERGDDDAEEENGSTRDGKFLPSQDSQEFWLVIIPSIDTSS